MNLKTFVKVGNISNLSDARYAAGFGVDMLGFNIDPSGEQAISINTAVEIMGWIAGATIVLECGSLPIEEITTFQKAHKFECIQVGNMAVANKLVDVDIILQQNITSIQQLKNLLNDGLMNANDHIQYVLLECSSCELFEPLDQIIAEYKGSMRLIKSFGIDTDAIERLLSIQSLKGIELKGAEEEQAGYKTYDQLADILEALEVED